MLTDSTPKDGQEVGGKDTLACGIDTENMSVPQSDQNHAQKEVGSGSNDSNDVLHTLREPQPPEVSSKKEPESRKVDDYGTYVAVTKAKINPAIGGNNSNNKRHDTYRASGQWYCRNCNDRGDRFYMNEETYCKGGKKQ